MWSTALDGEGTSDGGYDCDKELEYLGYVVPVYFDHISHRN